MSGKVKLPIPEPIAQLQRQLDQFRSTRQRRTRLPESLWQAAIELARQHGVYSVAQPRRNNRRRRDHPWVKVTEEVRKVQA